MNIEYDETATYDDVIESLPTSAGVIRKATATLAFHPEAWINDRARRVDRGATKFRVPLRDLYDFNLETYTAINESAGVWYLADEFCHHPNAPPTVSDWSGPFTIKLSEVTANDDSSDGGSILWNNSISEKYPTRITTTEAMYVSFQYSLGSDGTLDHDGEADIGDSVPGHGVEHIQLVGGPTLRSWKLLQKYQSILKDGKDPSSFFALEGVIDVSAGFKLLIEEVPPDLKWDGQFQLTAGGTGKIATITPDAVTFAWVNNGDRAGYCPDRCDNFETIVEEASKDVAPVTDEAEAIHASLEQHGYNSATWRTVYDGGNIEVFEYVPFEERVTDLATLETELELILDQTGPLNKVIDRLKRRADADKASQ